MLPGLGHALGGQFVEGCGLVALSGILAWAAPRALADPGPLATTWAGIALALWTVAWRYATHPAAAVVPAWDAFRANRTGVASLFAVLLLFELAALAPAISPFDPLAIDTGDRLAPPCATNLMGTDEFRRDVFSRALHGARVSLAIGIFAVGVAATVGTLLGAIAGYAGGVADRAFTWLVDLLQSLPRLVLVLAVVGTLRLTGRASALMVVVVLGLTGWMGIARVVRAETASFAGRDFVAAARALGLPSWRILLFHVLPNTLAPVIVFCSLAIGSTILVEAALGFLGLGVAPPTPTWGGMIREGKDWQRTAWWLTLFPGSLVVGAVCAFNLAGDALRDALDPRLRGQG